MNPIKRTLVVLFYLSTALPMGCFLSGSDKDDNSAASPNSKTEAMKSYDDTMLRVQDELYYTIGAVAAMDDALYADNETAVDDAIFELDYSADELILALSHLEDLENTIQSRSEESDGRIVQPLLFVVGAGAVIYGLYQFGKKMKSLSNKATEARNRRDKAAVDLTNDVPGSETAYKEAKDDLEKTGEEAVVEVTTKVTTELVLAPVETVSVGRILVKEVAGNAVQKGLKLLASTTDCASNGSETCPIAVGETDANGEISVPAGDVAVVVSTPQKTRAVVEEVVITPNETTTVTVDIAPIAETPPSDEDTGGDTDTWDTDSSSTDTGSADQTPACRELEACCNKELFADSPEFLAQCAQVVAENNDGHCQILLNNLAYQCDLL